VCGAQPITAVLPNACILWYFKFSLDVRIFSIADDRHWARPQNVRRKLMTTPKQTYNKDKLRLAKSYGYWWDVIMGGLLTSMILILVGNLVLTKLNLSLWFYPYSILCVLIVVFYQWRDDNLIVIKTGLSKANNFSLVTSCLDKLDWHYDKKNTNVELTSNKYILKFLNPTIIPDSEKILINFKYHATTKTGRLPFLFGISTFLEWTFKRTLKKSLLQTNVNQLDNHINNLDEKANA
jgi:hypothetical protein